ncbi:MAG: transglutaminase domain-containing protein, partial [Firmicutes bacterium]|nr:transglutaminase domain-containing protein [Bacillota bacterium]
VWESKKRNFWRDTPYSKERPEYTKEDMYNDVAEICEYYGKDIDIAPEFANKRSNIRVFDEAFSPSYLPSPLGTVADDKPQSLLDHFKYGPSGTVMRVRVWNQTPKVLDDDITYIETSPMLYALLRAEDVTGEEYINSLVNMDDTPSGAVSRLKEDYYAAVNHYTDKSGITPRIAELAQQITEGCGSDIKKAEAIVRYFEENGYKYSTEYIPPDNSVDYFLFESKTGYCAGYATAMTLMMRSLDIPTRYVEGFAAFERTQSGNIIVRDGYAHAFVEVYIPIAGWVTFDPTVSDYRNITASDSGFNSGWIFVLLFWLSRFFIVIIVLFFVVFVLLLDRIKERILRIVLVFMPVKKRVLKLYANLVGLVSFSEKEDRSYYTVKMLRSYLYETRGVVPELLLQLFEKTAFGGHEPTAEEYKAAYKQYKKCYRYLRKIPKEKTVIANKAKFTEI